MGQLYLYGQLTTVKNIQFLPSHQRIKIYEEVQHVNDENFSRTQRFGGTAAVYIKYLDLATTNLKKSTGK